MSCASCLAHVEGALRDVAGVLDVHVSLASGKAEISYVTPPVSVTLLQEAVEHAGYELTPIELEIPQSS